MTTDKTCPTCGGTGKVAATAEPAFPAGHFLFGTYWDDYSERVCIGVSTRATFDQYGCCQDGWSDSEYDFLADVMGGIPAGESMESIYEVYDVELTEDQVREALEALPSFTHEPGLTEFLKGLHEVPS